MEMPALGAVVDIVIEIPRGSRVKRRSGGTVDYASPIALPFDYGCVPDVLAGDGDPLDVIVIGGPRPAGTRLSLPIRAVIPFVDGGRPDPKLVCSGLPLTEADERRVRRFFWWFSRLKWALNRARGIRGRTGVESGRP